MSAVTRKRIHPGSLRYILRGRPGCIVHTPGHGIIGWDDFQKFSQIFMGIGQTSSVMLRWTLVLMKNLECYQKVQHKFSLWCEILICQICHFMTYSNFKISRFYISVRVSRYVLCLQRLLCIENVLFHSTRLSTHTTSGVKNGIWS